MAQGVKKKCPPNDEREREKDDRKVHSDLVPDAQATAEGLRQVGM